MVVTASARSLPARTCEMAAGMVTMSSHTCPPSVSATAGPPPLYGTWTMSLPVLSFSSSGAYRAAGASAVLDDDRLSERLRQAILHDARDDIGPSARRVRDDEVHRLCGPLLRPRGNPGEQTQHENDSLLHRRLLSFYALLVASSNSAVSAV